MFPSLQIKKKREHIFPSIIKMEMSVAPPFNMAPIFFIISHLGFSFPRSHTIHMILFTPPAIYSSNHMECALMPHATLHDITWFSLVMLPSPYVFVLLCVQGKSQPVSTICSSLFTFLCQSSMCQLYFMT